MTTQQQKQQQQRVTFFAGPAHYSNYSLKQHRATLTGGRVVRTRRAAKHSIKADSKSDSENELFKDMTSTWSKRKLSN